MTEGVDHLFLINLVLLVSVTLWRGKTRRVLAVLHIPGVATQMHIANVKDVLITEKNCGAMTEGVDHLFLINLVLLVSVTLWRGKTRRVLAVLHIPGVETQMHIANVKDVSITEVQYARQNNKLTTLVMILKA